MPQTASVMSYQLDGPRPPAGRSHSRYLGACPYGVASRSGTRDPRIGWRSGHAHVDPPFVSFRSTTKNACERSKEQISHRKADRKSTRLNSSHVEISYAVFCLKKKKNTLKGESNDKKEKKIKSL